MHYLSKIVINKNETVCMSRNGLSESTDLPDLS